MQSPLTFDHPWALVLLPLLLFFFWKVGQRSYAGLHPATQKLALITRGIVAALLVSAIAGAHLVKRSNTLTTLFVLDVSKSIRPDQRHQSLDYIQKSLQSRRSGDKAGVIVFGRTSYLEESPTETLQDLGDIHASVAGDATNLSEALRLAGAAFPPGSGKKIVLLSDGNENIGDAAGEIDSLRTSGIRVDIAPTDLGTGTGGAISGEAMVESVNLPTQARQGAPFNLRVVVSSTVAQSATLTLQRDGQPVGTQKVSLKTGKNAFNFQEKVDQTGFHRYDALLTPTIDSVAENNHGYGFVSVQGRPRILYVTDTDTPSYNSLKQAMAAQQIDLDIRPPGALPPSVAALASYDTVVLSNVPSEELGPQQMTALQVATRDFGVGLGMVGGENSYAAGQYGDTPIEDALPVRMDVKDKKRFPSIAIAMVIEDLEEPTNVNMSIEAAKATIDLLDPQDQVGVIDCNGTWRIPMQFATNKAAIKSAMQGMTDMNDPPTYDPYLLEAARVLSTTHAQVKHIIFLGDGDASPPTVGNVQSIRHMGITLSTVATGADAEGVKELAAVAAVGGGQAYVSEKPQDLPHLLLKDQQSISRLKVIEKPILPRYNPADEVITGINFNAEPPLLGYNVSTPKPGATVALASPDHSDPIFAYWRYGLGRTFAFTSDDRAHWAVNWLPWDGYTRFWAQTLRWSLRSSARADFQTVLDTENGRGHLVVDAFTQGGGFVNKASMTATVVAPDLTTKQVSLAQTGPGRYEGHFDTDQTGAYLVNVRGGGASAGGAAASTPAAASQTLGLVVPYSPEYRTLGPNLPLLTRLSEATGGKIQNDPSRIFRDAQSWVVGTLDLAPALLLLTALLFLVDIAVRRLAIRPQQVRETAAHGVEAAGARLNALRESRNAGHLPPSTPEMNRLLERKSASRAASAEDDDTSATQRLLNRRASRDTSASDDAFPQVASLAPKPKPPVTKPDGDASADGAYTNRLLDAKRRAQQKDD